MDYPVLQQATSRPTVMVTKSPDLIVGLAAEAASAAQSVTVSFNTGDAISEGLDSCTTSRKYVINSPRSYKSNIIRQNNNITFRSAANLLIIC